MGSDAAGPAAEKPAQERRSALIALRILDRNQRRRGRPGLWHPRNPSGAASGPASRLGRGEAERPRRVRTRALRAADEAGPGPWQLGATGWVETHWRAGRRHSGGRPEGGANSAPDGTGHGGDAAAGRGCRSRRSAGGRSLKGGPCPVRGEEGEGGCGGWGGRSRAWAGASRRGPARFCPRPGRGRGCSCAGSVRRMRTGSGLPCVCGGGEGEQQRLGLGSSWAALSRPGRHAPLS